MADLISRAYVLAEYDRQHQGPPGGARKIMTEAPAVDAVPVEWLRKVRNDDKLTLDDVETIDLLLAWWQREQEAQK